MHAAETSARTTVPRVTLYVKDSDAPIWERAKALTSGADDSLSSFVAEALTDLVQKRERSLQATRDLADHMETVKLNGADYFDEEKPRKLRFTGMLVTEDAGTTVYITKAKKVVMEVYRPHGADLLRVFESFEEFRDDDRHGLDASTITMVADALGEEYFEEID
jgi:hypothetical protein